VWQGMGGECTAVARMADWVSVLLAKWRGRPGFRCMPARHGMLSDGHPWSSDGYSRLVPHNLCPCLCSTARGEPNIARLVLVRRRATRIVGI